MNSGTVGTRLKTLREAAGLTLEEAGRIGETTKQSVSQIEKGVTKVPGGLPLYLWSRHYRVNLEWLITGKGDQYAESHAGRLDPEKVAITTRAINRILDRRIKGMTLDLSQEVDAELFSVAYAECELLEHPSEADMVPVVADLMLAREARRGRESEQVGGANRGKGRKARAG